MRYQFIIINILSILLLSCNGEKGTKPVVQDIKELVFASGTLEWNNSYNLNAQTDGILTNVNFEIGDTLFKGKILAKIENNSNIINTATAKAQLNISKENLSANSPALQQVEQNIIFATAKYKQDKLQAERYERLFKSQSVAQAEYENYRLAAQNSLSNLNVLNKNYAALKQQAKQNYITTKGQLQNNELAKKYNEIIVPQSGTVIDKIKNNGDYVKKGDIIATIADAKLIQAVLNVDETTIAKIKVGQTVYIKLNTEDSKIYTAKITEILAAFDLKSQSFICKAIFNEPLTHAFFGTQLEANIFTKEKKNALLIPRSLMDFGNRVNVKGKDQEVVIKTGIISSEFVEVLGGITKEDVILPLKH